MDAAKLTRGGYFSRKSNSVKPKVGRMSEIFCNFTALFLKKIPLKRPVMGSSGAFAKVQIIYLSDKQIVVN